MRKTVYIGLSLLLWLMPLLVEAQEYKVSTGSKVTIVGTSTMHDWESIVEQVSGKGTFTVETSGIKSINNLNVNFVVKSIKSGKSKMADINYDALKEEQNPTIIFNLTTIISGNGKKMRKYWPFRMAVQLPTGNSSLKLSSVFIIRVFHPLGLCCLVLLLLIQMEEVRLTLSIPFYVIR